MGWEPKARKGRAGGEWTDTKQLRGELVHLQFLDPIWKTSHKRCDRKCRDTRARGSWSWTLGVRPRERVWPGTPLPSGGNMESRVQGGQLWAAGEASTLPSRWPRPGKGRRAPLPRLPEPPLQRGRLASTRRARYPQGFRHRVLRHYLNGQTLSLVWRVPGTQVSHSFRPHKVAVKNEVLCPPLTSSAQRSRLPRQSKTTLELVPRPASVSWCPGPHTAHARTSPDFP